MAHERGDITSATTYREQLLILSQKVGMGLARESFQTAAIDLLMRNHDFGAAIELCQSAMASELPVMSRALYEQLLATAYSFTGNLDEACTHGRKAIAIFEKIGAINAASDAIVKLASDLSSYRQDEPWNEAEALLETWVRKDTKRSDYAAAINKYELLAQININRRLYSTARRDLTFLDNAEAYVVEAETLADQLPNPEAARRIGGLTQLRGQIYQGRDEEDKVVQVCHKALSIYENADFRMETANCRYILGVLYLNRANQEFEFNFGESEKHLREALSYYDSAGMRGQAADTRYMLAFLYSNATHRATQDFRKQLLDALIFHLSNAEADYDAIRREFGAGKSVIEIQRAKRSFVEKSQRIYALTFRDFVSLSA